MEGQLTEKIPAGRNNLIKELVTELHDVVSDLENLSQQGQDYVSGIVPCADCYDPFGKEKESLDMTEKLQEHILFNRLIALKNRLVLLRTHKACVIRHIEKI